MSMSNNMNNVLLLMKMFGGPGRDECLLLKSTFIFQRVNLYLVQNVFIKFVRYISYFIYFVINMFTSHRVSTSRYLFGVTTHTLSVVTFLLIRCRLLMSNLTNQTSADYININYFRA